MKLRVPSHATVVAYLALFIAVGGSAYAVSKIDSRDIANRSIRGKDVATDTLGARPINGPSLPGPTAVGNEQSAGCDPSAGVDLDCIGVTIGLQRKTAVFVAATGSKRPGPGEGGCSLTVDGQQSNGTFFDSTASDGFALTKVTPPLPAGSHPIVLRCTEIQSDFAIDRPTIAAIAVESD